MIPTYLREYLGPFLGFMCTSGTILFIALNAHKTGRRAPGTVTPAEASASAPPEAGTSGTPATGTSL